MNTHSHERQHTCSSQANAQQDSYKSQYGQSYAKMRQSSLDMDNHIYISGLNKDLISSPVTYNNRQSMFQETPEIQSFQNSQSQQLLNLHIPMQQIPTVAEVSEDTDKNPIKHQNKELQTMLKETMNVQELQQMIDQELKKKMPEIKIGEESIVNIPKIKIICRIKPPKTASEPEVCHKYLEFEKRRQLRSVSRSKMFQFNQNKHTVETEKGQSFSSPDQLQLSFLTSLKNQRIPNMGVNTLQQTSGTNQYKRNNSNEQERGKQLDTVVENQYQSTRNSKPIQLMNVNTPKRKAVHSNNLKHMVRSSSLGQQPGLMYNKMLKNEGMYCIFTTREASNIVLASDQPLSGKMLNDSIKTVQDSTLLSNQPVHFTFDSVYDETSSGRQERLYNTNIKHIVHNFIEGRNGCVVLLGPSDCGKTYTLKGGLGSERGIVPRAIEDVLQIIGNKEYPEKELNNTPNFQHQQRLFLKMSIYMITLDQIYDLLQRKTQDIKNPIIEHYLDQEQNVVISQLVNVHERLILNAEDFYVAISDAYKYRKDLGLNKYQDRDIRKKSHFVVSFNLVQQTNDRVQRFTQISQLNFVELSGSEQAVNTQKMQTFNNIRHSALHEFVSKSFNSLSCHMMRLVQKSTSKHNDSSQALISEETETKLLGCLRSTLTTRSNILIVNCVDPSQHLFEHCLPSLKFCSSIKEQIQKRIRKLKATSKKTLAKKKGSTSQAELYKLLLSQIKAAERLTKDFKQKLIDNEYKLFQNPQNQDIINQCHNQVNSLSELIRDFDTLISYSQNKEFEQNQLLIELVKSAHACRSKVGYLKQKILVMIQEKSIANVQIIAPSDNISNPFLTKDDNRSNHQHYTLRSDELQVQIQEPKFVDDQNAANFEGNLHHSMDENRQRPPHIIQGVSFAGLHQFNTVDNRQHKPVVFQPQNLQDQSQRSQSQEKPINLVVPPQLSTRQPSNEKVTNLNLNKVLHSYTSSLGQEQPQLYSPSPQYQVPQLSYRSNTHINQVHQFEGKFSQIKNEVKSPRLMGMSDLPQVENFKKQLMVDTKKFNNIIEKTPTKQLYKSEDEIVSDIQRLMYLQDFEGLKMRVLNLYRENDQISNNVNQQLYKIVQELNDSHAQANEKLVQEYNRILAHNNQEIKTFSTQMQQQYSLVEQEILQDYKQMESVIKDKDLKIKQLNETIQLTLTEKGQVEKDRDEDIRLRLEAQNDMKQYQVENDKLKKNYEILKEHEMNVIRDCENKKNSEIKEKTDALFNEKQRCMQLQLNVDSSQLEIMSLKEQIMKLTNDATFKDTEKSQLQDKIKDYQSEIITLKSEVQSHKQKHTDAQDNIQSLKQQQELFKMERDQKHFDYNELRKELKMQEQNEHAINNEMIGLKSDISLLQSEIQQLHCDKEGLREQLQQQYSLNSQLQTEKEMLAVQFKDEKNQLSNQYSSLQQLVSQKDREIMTMKASEYDKVDVVKKLAEIEGKNKYLAQDNDRLVRKVNEFEQMVSAQKREIDQLNHHLKDKDQQTRNLNAHHNANLEQFDYKFDGLHCQLQEAISDNQNLQSLLKESRDKHNELERERQYWKDKCRAAERKSSDISNKIAELEQELKSIIFEKQSLESGSTLGTQEFAKQTEQQQNQLQSQLQKQSIEQKKQVIGDIQGMIKQFKKERNDSYSRLQQVQNENRPLSYLEKQDSRQNLKSQLSEPTIASSSSLKKLPPSILKVPQSKFIINPHINKLTTNKKYQASPHFNSMSASGDIQELTNMMQQTDSLNYSADKDDVMQHKATTNASGISTATVQNL